MKFSSKSKKILLAVICSLICILLVIWLAVSFFSNHSDDNGFPFGEDENIRELSWFGEETYSELHETCSDITGKVSGDNAYLWIKYWQRVYDTTGKEIMGRGSQKEMIKVRIAAEEQDGKWVATKTMQGP